MEARGIVVPVVPEVPESVDDVPEREGEVPVAAILSLQSSMDKGFEKIMEKFGEMDNKISLLHVRVKELEAYVAVQLHKDLYDELHLCQMILHQGLLCQMILHQGIMSQMIINKERVRPWLWSFTVVYV